MYTLKVKKDKKDYILEFPNIEVWENYKNAEALATDKLHRKYLSAIGDARVADKLKRDDARYTFAVNYGFNRKGKGSNRMVISQNDEPRGVA